MDLSRQEDHVLNTGEMMGAFAYFRSSEDPQRSMPVFSLVSNRSAAGSLIPEAREYDFFLMADNLRGERERRTFLRAVQGIRGVLAVTPLDPMALKSRQNLIIA
jgi:hypothetical protein